MLPTTHDFTRILNDIDIEITKTTTAWKESREAFWKAAEAFPKLAKQIRDQEEEIEWWQRQMPPGVWPYHHPSQRDQAIRAQKQLDYCHEKLAKLKEQEDAQKSLQAPFEQKSEELETQLKALYARRRVVVRHEVAIRTIKQQFPYATLREPICEDDQWWVSTTTNGPTSLGTGESPAKAWIAAAQGLSVPEAV